MFCAEISSGFPGAFQRQAGRPSLGLVAGSCVSSSAAEVLETSLRNKTQPYTGCRAAQRIPLCSLDIFHPTPHKLLGFCVKRVILQIKSVLVSSLLAWQPRRIDGTALLQLSWLLSHLHAARLGWGSAQLRHVALLLVPAETPNWSPGCWGSGAKPRTRPLQSYTENSHLGQHRLGSLRKPAKKAAHQQSPPGSQTPQALAGLWISLLPR